MMLLRIMDSATGKKNDLLTRTLNPRTPVERSILEDHTPSVPSHVVEKKKMTQNIFSYANISSMIYAPIPGTQVHVQPDKSSVFPTGNCCFL